MTLFFLLVGLEIRREFDMGEFRDRRRVAVPVAAAIGGMLLPILIFLAMNPGGESAKGWAMVMATDTAFAVGVLALVGRRSSVRLRIFLLTLVIIDDVVAISVIALFYSENVQPIALIIALGLLAVMAIMRWRGVTTSAVYLLLGIGIWLAAYEAGVHPTVAGVAIGLLTGAHPPRRASLEEATGVVRAFRVQPSVALGRAAANRITMALSPNERLQHQLHPLSSYIIIPLFALANAGVDLSGNLVERIFGSPLTMGIVFGLVAGKTLGIPLGAWIATRPWLGGLPLSVGWPSLIAASSVAGIGFTVSLLIANLSYTGMLLEEARLGIIFASLLAAILSVTMFYTVSHLPRRFLQRADAQAAPPLTDLVVPVDFDHDHFRGPRDAIVTLVGYGDYECRHCGRAAPVVKKLLEEFDGELCYVMRHLPLPDVHPNAALAAEAAEAAGAQGQFWEMHDLLFEHQDALLPHHLIGYAKQLGLDEAKFSEALQSGKYGTRVSHDIASADASGVAATPTFFVNEVRHRGAHDLATLEKAIRGAMLAEQRRREFAPNNARNRS